MTIDGEDETKLITIERIWQRYGDQLRRRARTRLRQYGLSAQAESMDICNDVMADLIRRQSAGRSRLNPATRSAPPSASSASPSASGALDQWLPYIMRAIDNQVIDTFRTLARQCRDFRRNESPSQDNDVIASTATTPSQIAIRHEVIDRIRSMLGQEDSRAVTMMLENRDWKEIGEAIGMQPDAARMRIKRALERVRQEIGVSEENYS